jgi:hypothetical protein
MLHPIVIRAPHAVQAFLCAFLWLALLPAAAHEAQQTIPEPGFRPPSEYAPAFVEAVGGMSIEVLPTLVRRIDRTALSFTSQRDIVDFLNSQGIATATARPDRLDLGPLRRDSQWNLFQQGLSAVSGVAVSRDSDADYLLLMEILVPGDEEVFGIEVYIVDAQGRNAFSYLLNSHHQMFAEARLTAGASEAARQKMIADATRTGLLALQPQMREAEECALRESIPVPVARAGVLHDFDGPLVSGADPWGVPLGYSTFKGPDTTVTIATTGYYPVRAGTEAGNGVLQVDLNVGSWGGVTYRFANEAMDQWIPQDWRPLDGFSFWFHGSNSGTELFLDIFDNRHACSKTDDAERFRYRFWDDVAGWRLIKVRFQDLAREDVFNDAPDDGLGLSRVHGWGLGALNTGGALTFFMDDFRLLQDAGEAMPPDAARIPHGALLETRLTQDVSRIEVSTQDGGGLVAERALGLMCGCARLAAERGFRYFRVDEREMLSNGRARFRLTFYRTRPTDVPVLERPLPSGDEGARFDVSAAIPAEDYLRICPP